MIRRRKLAQPEDAFDRMEWRQLSRAVKAGIRLDPNQMAAELRVLDRSFPMSARSGAYVYYALRYQAAKLVGARPTPADLMRLTANAADRFNRLVTVAPDALADLLLAVLEYEPFPSNLRGSGLIVHGAAALAALTEDPTELDALEPHLASWYNANGAQFFPLKPLGT